MQKFKIDEDISKAHTLDKKFYTDPLFLEESRKKIFYPSWHIIPFEAPANIGDLRPFYLLEHFLAEPLLLSKDKDAIVHCLSNVCTHRGNILCTDAINSAQIRCGYHGRIFNLDGKLRSMPEFKEVKNFPSSSDDLTDLPFFNWGKWLFISLDKKYRPEFFLENMMERLAWLPVNAF